MKQKKVGEIKVDVNEKITSELYVEVKILGMKKFKIKLFFTKILLKLVEKISPVKINITKR